MITGRNLALLLCALAPLSCKTNGSSSLADVGGAPKFDDVCVQAGGVGSIPDAYKDKNAAGVTDNSDFPSVAIDDNTLAVVSLYDNPNWIGKGRCVVVLTKSQPSVTTINGTYQYQYDSSWGAASRSKSVKLFYLAAGNKISFNAGGYNPQRVDYLPKPFQCYDFNNQYAYLIAGTPYCNPTKVSNMLSDSYTGFTVSNIGMMGSLFRVTSGNGITVKGDGRAAFDFENVINKIEITQ